MRCFISHATADRNFVERELLALLKAIDVEGWVAEIDIKTASQWERSIKHNLESSEWFMLVMSPKAAKSEWVKDEVSWAFENRAGNIIPVLMEPCTAEDFHIRLPRIQYVDFSTEPEQARLSLIRTMVELKEQEPPRSTAIDGKWCGTIFQDCGPNGEPTEYPIVITLSARRKRIEGEYQIELPESFKDDDSGPGPLIIDFSVTGGLQHASFVQLNYESIDQTKIHFGSILLELSPLGDVLQGNFVGYGAYTRAIVKGGIRLNKK